MELSPFPYQGPLEPDQVHGRGALIDDLIERVTERRLTALLGPRRFGKTSVLRRVAADLIHAGTLVVWTDLYEVASMADIAARLDAGLARITGKAGDGLARLAATLNINLGAVSVSLRAPSRDRADPVLTLHALLDLITHTAARQPTVLIVDEFAGIARVEGAAGILRTRLQHHFQTLGLLVAGSEPAMMRTLFTDHVQPFYGQADLVEIGPLGRSDVVELVQDGFASTGREAGPVAARVFDFTGGHPQRTMQAADTAWRLTPSGEAATLDTWAEALEALRRATADGNERLYSSLQDKEKAVLRLLARNRTLFGADAELLDLTSGAAQHARARLAERGHLIQRDDGTWSIVDPVLADWVAGRFPI